MEAGLELGIGDGFPASAAGFVSTSVAVVAIAVVVELAGPVARFCSSSVLLLPLPPPPLTVGFSKDGDPFVVTAWSDILFYSVLPPPSSGR